MLWIEGYMDDEKKYVPMISETVRLGRSKHCDFSFPDDKEVSRIHAIIELREKGWYVVDNKSTNGSYVNEQRVTVPFPVKEGDLIRVGEQRLRIKSGIELPAPESFASKYPGFPYYYLVLKVPPGAGKDVIDLAYIELGKVFDPALHPASERVRVCLKEIEEAYAVLSEPARRLTYDASLPASYFEPTEE